jgi:hypothetical protein
MKACCGSGGIAPRILISALEVSGQLHARPLYPHGKSPGTHWIGGWVGPKAGLDAVMKLSYPGS